MPNAHRSRFSPCAALLLALVFAGCAALESGRDIPVTPQRPTFSNDTQTTAAGTWELESGLSVDPGDRLGTPSALKLGLNERSEVFVGFEPLIVLDAPGSDEYGFGDLLLGYRRRVLEAEAGRPSAAWQAVVKAPSADEDDGLGSGETDVLGSLALNWAGDVWSTTGFLQLGLLGDPSGGTAWQPACAVATGRPLDGPLGAFGELAWVSTPEFDDEQLFTTLGLTWAQDSGRVFDAGVVVGLSDDAPDFQFLVGTTLNLGPTGR